MQTFTRKHWKNVVITAVLPYVTLYLSPTKLNFMCVYVCVCVEDCGWMCILLLTTEYHTHTLNLSFIGQGNVVVMTLFIQVVFGEPAQHEPCNLLPQQAPTNTRTNYCQLAQHWTLSHIHTSTLMQIHLLYNWRKGLILAGVLRHLPPNSQALCLCDVNQIIDADDSGWTNWIWLDRSWLWHRVLQLFKQTWCSWSPEYIK